MRGPAEKALDLLCRYCKHLGNERLIHSADFRVAYADLVVRARDLVDLVLLAALLLFDRKSFFA